MKRTSKMIMAAVIVAVLLLGIGYAAIQNITLNIAGTAAADPSQANFKVMFSGTPTVSDDTYVTAAITDDINATMNVEGLTKKGDVVSATYTVQNTSEDLSADLSIATTNSNTEFFTLKSEIAKTSLIAGEATTLTVTVELTKTPIVESVNATIGVQLEAMPVQPGEEGTSEGINGSSQTPALTLGKITKDNIGDYIDLGNNIINEESTTDDWRILYKDETAVYAVLDDYLPVVQIPEEAGLTTDLENTVYNVWSDDLVNKLLNNAAWSEFTNGILGAKAIGAPKVEMFVDSYNAKNGTELVYTDRPKLDSTTEDYDLYVPHPDYTGEVYGHWLASIPEGYSDWSWVSSFDGMIRTNAWTLRNYAVRPVVELPLNTECSYNNGIWTVD